MTHGLWPHQRRGLADIREAVTLGRLRVCVTSPTGGGKTRVMAELVRQYLDESRLASLYTNRRLLVEQTSQVMHAEGLDHGIRSSGYQERLHAQLQVSSLQTEHSRVLKKKTWKLHNSDLAIIDEAHSQKGQVARTIIDRHVNDNCPVVGFTATPLGLGDLYDHLIVAGTPSELRACGALVRCDHYGPDEPDLRHIKKVEVGEDLTLGQQKKAMGGVDAEGEPDRKLQSLFANVIEWYGRLNPAGRPTILFAPGVQESRWFAQQFFAAGIPAAHIDGEEVWLNGTFHRTSRSAREFALEASRSGKIKVLCNRYVLREGIDAPWLSHGILATVFGSLQSYLQSGGRLLRAYPGLEAVTLQDHGGNWHRHGSLNADRVWNLNYTAGMVSAMREDGLRSKSQPEPCRCPKCSRILIGYRCPGCGFEIPVGRKSRPVVMADGTLKEMRGDIYRPRRTVNTPDAEKLWERMYYRGRNSGMTFRQCEALFAVENNWNYPSREFRLMPADTLDFFLPVNEVERERLR